MAKEVRQLYLLLLLVFILQHYTKAQTGDALLFSSIQSHSKKAQPATLYYLKLSATAAVVFRIALEGSFPLSSSLLIDFESKQSIFLALPYKVKAAAFSTLCKLLL